MVDVENQLQPSKDEISPLSFVEMPPDSKIGELPIKELIEENNLYSVERSPLKEMILESQTQSLSPVLTQFHSASPDNSNNTSPDFIYNKTTAD